MSHRIEVLDPHDRAQVERCFRVVAFLRPHLSAEQFHERLQVQAGEGYNLVYIADDGDGAVSAAAGYRIGHYLAWGKILYVDDLVTHPDRKNRGLGGALMDWLIARAREQRCDELHLDTGFTRHDAHRLYLNKGLLLSCHHMSLKLT